MTRDLPVGRDGAQDPAAAGGARRVDRHGGRQQRGLLLTCFDCRGASFPRRRRLGVGKSGIPAGQAEDDRHGPSQAAGKNIVGP